VAPGRVRNPLIFHELLELCAQFRQEADLEGMFGHYLPVALESDGLYLPLCQGHAGESFSAPAVGQVFAIVVFVFLPIFATFRIVVVFPIFVFMPIITVIYFVFVELVFLPFAKPIYPLFIELIFVPIVATIHFIFVKLIFVLFIIFLPIVTHGTREG